MRFSLRHIGVIGCVSGLLLTASTVAMSAGGEAEQQYQNAIENNDITVRYDLWKKVMETNGAAELASEGIHESQIRWHMIDALLERARVERDVTLVSEALELAEQFSDPDERFWAEIRTARSFAELRKKEQAQRILERQLAALDAIADRAVRSARANAIAVTGLLIKNGSVLVHEKGLEIAEQAMDAISSAQHRANATQDYADMRLLRDGNESYLAAMKEKNAKRRSALLIADAQEAASDDLPQAILLAHTVPLSAEGKRQKLFKELFRQALKQQSSELAVQAVYGIVHTPTQADMAKELVDYLQKRGEIGRIAMLAPQIDDPRYAAEAWLTAARAFHQQDMLQRRDRALKEAETLAVQVEDDARRAKTVLRVAKVAATCGHPAITERLLKGVAQSEMRDKAVFALIKALADGGDVEKASELLVSYDVEVTDGFDPAIKALARGYAKRKDAKAIRALLDDFPELKPDSRDYIRQKLQEVEIKRSGAVSDDLLPDTFETGVGIVSANLTLARMHAKAERMPEADGFENAARLRLDGEVDFDKKKREITLLGVYLAEIGKLDAAQEAADMLPPDERGDVLKELGRGLARQNKLDDVEALVAGIKEPSVKHQVIATAAPVMLDHHALERAAELVRSIDDDTLRVSTFRALAEKQAVLTDAYGILTDRDDISEEHYRLLVPSSVPVDAVDDDDVAEYQQKTRQFAIDNPVEVLARKPQMSKLGVAIPEVREARRLGFDTAFINRSIPAFTRFSLDTLYYEYNRFNRKFVYVADMQGFTDAQQSAIPEIIVLRDGVADLPMLYDRLHQRGKGDYISRDGNVYTLHRPLFVNPKATLVIAGPEVEELRMSAQQGTYLVNAGKLFMTGTRITAWDLAKGEPQLANYKTVKHYRPFITTWSRSRSYMADTVFTGLGYKKSKSYGLTFSAGPSSILKFRPEHIGRPEAVLVDNSFRNMMFGFYSYEADNIVIVGNEYVDNIVYGIDPHDRSRWFTMAYNTMYGTERKHGLIISREVNDSTILGNLSFDNHGSGIMVDRLSTGTLIYANSSFANHQDGLTIYESNCKIVASNRFFDNDRSGIKVRNSAEVGIFFNEISNNSHSGVHGYAVNLREMPSHASRNFIKDPYSDVAAVTLVGNLVEANAIGVKSDDLSALYLKANRFVRQSPNLVKGNWTSDVPRILAQHNMEEDGVFLTSRCPDAKYILAAPCVFRKEGFFRGDGQGDLIDRFRDNPCLTEKAAAGEEG